MKTSTLLIVLLVLLPTSVYAGEKIELSLEVAADANINIEDPQSRIEIVGWKKNSVKVVGEISDKASDYSFEKSGNGAIFEVEYANGEAFDRKLGLEQHSQLKFYVPLNSQLQVSNINGEIQVSDIKGGTSLETINASISVEKLSGRISVETINGDIRAKDNQGRINIETINGKFMDEGSSGELDLSTVQGNVNVSADYKQLEIEVVNGDLDLELAKVDELNIDSVNGKIRAMLSLNRQGDLSVSNVNGQIELLFDKNISAEFEIDSFVGGSIVNKLSEDKALKKKFGPGRNLSFSLRDGSGQVEVNTVGGKIKLGHR